MSKLDRDQVEHMARLSRLALTDAEAETYTRQLAAILEYASRLPDLHAHIEESALRMEEDVARTCENPHDLLRNAIELVDGQVKVPAILDRSES